MMSRDTDTREVLEMAVEKLTQYAASQNDGYYTIEEREAGRSVMYEIIHIMPNKKSRTLFHCWDEDWDAATSFYMGVLAAGMYVN